MSYGYLFLTRERSLAKFDTRARARFTTKGSRTKRYWFAIGRKLLPDGLFEKFAVDERKLPRLFTDENHHTHAAPYEHYRGTIKSEANRCETS